MVLPAIVLQDDLGMHYSFMNSVTAKQLDKEDCYVDVCYLQDRVDRWVGSWAVGSWGQMAHMPSCWVTG